MSTTTFLQQHPLGQIMPRMDKDQYGSLSSDIKTNGLASPIIIYENKVLDGWHRYNVCISGSIEPRYETYTGTTPATFVMSHNLERRHLTAGQKAAVAVEVLPLLETEAKQRQSAGLKKGTSPVVAKLPPREKGKTRDIAAKTVGASARYVQDAKSIKTQSPELFEKVKQGGLNIKQAKNELYKKSEAIKKTTSKVEIKNSDRKQLYNCDILAAPIKDNSLDVIITDPPYPKEYLECWNKLAEFASKKLKPGGVLLAMSGQSYLPEVYSRMNVQGLNYYWTCCISYTVSPDLWTVRTKTQWKPLLWYVKGKYDRTYQPTDVFTSNYSDALNGQAYHKWGQSLPLFNEIVNRFTYAGETVCDPFLGGGTTGIATLKQEPKRKFIGIELSKDTFDIASKRIQEACGV